MLPGIPVTLNSFTLTVEPVCDSTLRQVEQVCTLGFGIQNKETIPELRLTGTRAERIWYSRFSDGYC